MHCVLAAITRGIAKTNHRTNCICVRCSQAAHCWKSVSTIRWKCAIFIHFIFFLYDFFCVSFCFVLPKKIIIAIKYLIIIYLLSRRQWRRNPHLSPIVVVSIKITTCEMVPGVRTQKDHIYTTCECIFLYIIRYRQCCIYL